MVCRRIRGDILADWVEGFFAHICTPLWFQRFFDSLTGMEWRTRTIHGALWEKVLGLMEANDGGVCVFVVKVGGK